jgi:DcmR-like sensory protein
MSAVESIQTRSPSIFWGELAPCEHICQIYGDDDVFLDALGGFVSGGLHGEESVIVIASDEHVAALDRRLRLSGLDLDHLRSVDRYICLSAEACLTQFMVNGWPSDEAFDAFVSGVIGRARRGDRQVRAFGEMVAVLWAKGHYAATVRLEHLWNRLLKAEKFPLFCAYPRAGFVRGASEAISELNAAHTRMVSN